MFPVRRLATATAAGLAALTAILPAALPATAAPHPHPHEPAATHAVFVQTDDPGGNAVVAYRRSPSGVLTQAGRYPTGGSGGMLAGSVVDHLASEGSLTYAAGVLYAVNAGSDTVTAFAVHGDRLVRTQVVSSGGSFPVSVAAHGRLVYVLNARDGGSIQGFVRVGDRLVSVPRWHRALGLDPDQTPEFTSTPGQVAFSPDGRHLLVTTKNGGNSIAVYAVGPFGLAESPTVTSLPGGVPFGLAFDRSGHLAVTEAGPSAVATFVLRHDGSLRALDDEPTGQAATCWVVAARGHLYASNAGSGTLSSFTDERSVGLRPLATTPTSAGTVDAAATPDGRFLYVQGGAAGTVDGFRVGRDGQLTPVGTLTVPGAVGAEGIVAR